LGSTKPGSVRARNHIARFGWFGHCVIDRPQSSDPRRCVRGQDGVVELPGSALGMSRLAAFGGTDANGSILTPMRSATFRSTPRPTPTRSSSTPPTGGR
jgi:hypothetical protein